MIISTTNDTDRNAQLIAAAPKLLEALRMVVRWNDEDQSTRRLEDALAAAHAAIAEAEG